MYKTLTMKILKSQSINAFGGINFVFEYFDQLKIGNFIDSNLPILPRQSHYSWKDIFYSLSSLYFCNGEYIEDINSIIKKNINNNPFCNIASYDTILKRLKELDEGSQTCRTKRGTVDHSYSTNDLLSELNIKLLKNIGVFNTPVLTLDYDNTIIYSEKMDCKMTYKKKYGYQPGVCTVNQNEEASNELMMEEKKMKGLLSIVKNQSDAIQPVVTDVLFIQHLSRVIRDTKSVKSDRTTQRGQIKELISQSIESEDIVDVFAMAGIDKPDISILNDEFLLGAKQDKLGIEIKIEMLRNILKNELKLRLHKNIKYYTSLKEEIEKVIDRYHSNAIDSYTTILELIERAKAMQNEDTRTKELGLSEEELAFYDILHAKEDIIKEQGQIQGIVHAVVKAVKNNLEIDWTKKENAKATIRLAVKKELRGKVTISELNKILQEIMEQAEGQYSEYYPEIG